MHKNFNKYSEAYALYSEIVSGRDVDRKNPSIFLLAGSVDTFRVYWEVIPALQDLILEHYPDSFYAKNLKQ